MDEGDQGTSEEEGDGEKFEEYGSIVDERGRKVLSKVLESRLRLFARRRGFCRIISLGLERIKRVEYAFSDVGNGGE